MGNVWRQEEFRVLMGKSTEQHGRAGRENGKSGVGAAPNIPDRTKQSQAEAIPCSDSAPVYHVKTGVSFISDARPNQFN